MSYYDDDAHQEYKSALSEQGYPELDHDDNLEPAIDQFLQDLDRLPDGMRNVFDLMMQGYTLADAVYQAGYCNNSEGLYHLVGHDNGMGMKDKLEHFKGVHASGRERADARRSQGAQQSEY